MSKEQELPTSAVAEVEEDAEPVSDTKPTPVQRSQPPPVESRFMFVDIAALRAKQLRRGALARVDLGDASAGEATQNPKLERIAMQEIEEGLIYYELPENKADASDKKTAAKAL